MPWTMKSALGHTKKADSPAKKKQWSATANAVLKQSGDEGKAVRIANAAVAKKTAKAKVNKMKDTSKIVAKPMKAPKAKKTKMTNI